MLIKSKGNKIDLFDSIESAPMKRYVKYQYYALLDSGIGSDMASVDQHYTTILKYGLLGEKDKLQKEIDLARQNISFVLNGVSPKLLSLAVLVKSVNGKECNDLTEDGLKEVCKKLENISYSHIEATLEDLKKKFDSEMEKYFPKKVNTSHIKDYFTLMQKRALIEIDILLGKQLQEELKKIEDEMFDMYEPQVFHGENGVEVSNTKNYKDACTMIKQNTGKDTEDMTVIDFYQTLDYLEAQIKKYGKSDKK